MFEVREGQNPLGGVFVRDVDFGIGDGSFTVADSFMGGPRWGVTQDLSGEPNVRQLEPDLGLAAPTRGTSCAA